MFSESSLLTQWMYAIITMGILCIISIISIRLVQRRVRFFANAGHVELMFEQTEL